MPPIFARYLAHEEDQLQAGKTCKRRDSTSMQNWMAAALAVRPLTSALAGHAAVPWLLREGGAQSSHVRWTLKGAPAFKYEDQQMRLTSMPGCIAAALILASP